MVDEGVKKFERINILVSDKFKVGQSNTEFNSNHIFTSKVNDAGVLEDYSGLEDIDMNVFDDTINTNLRAVVELTKYAIPHLIKSKGNLIHNFMKKILSSWISNISLFKGNVVNVSSIAGLKGTKRGHLAYAISKAGLNLFTVNSAVEFASRGVRFNAVK